MRSSAQIAIGLVLTPVLFIVSGALTPVFHRQFAAPPATVPFFFFGVLIVLTGLAIAVFRKKGVLEFSGNPALLMPSRVLRVATVSLLVALASGVGLWYLAGVLGLDAGERHGFFSMSAYFAVPLALMVAPLGEELLFRGFLQNMLSPWKATGLRIGSAIFSVSVLVAAAVFALSHVPLALSGMGTVGVVLTIAFGFCSGAVAGYFQEQYGNFGYAVVAHAAANLPAIASTFVFP